MGIERGERAFDFFAALPAPSLSFAR